MAKSLWAGLDTGADTSRLSVIDDDMQPVFEVTLPSRPAAIDDALRTLGDTKIIEIAAEATSTSIHIAHGLRDIGYPFSLYETANTSRYLRLRRNKTDRNDARGLAEIAKLQIPSINRVFLKSPEIQRVRSSLHLRDQMVTQRVACEGMMRSLFRLYGGKLRPSRSSLQIDRHVRAEIARLDADRGVDLSPELLPLLDLCIAMRRYVEALDTDFAGWARLHPVCSRFLAIPGVGAITAISFYTAVEDPWRFRSATDVGPYFGLTPKVDQSGSSLKHGRISRKGSTATRAHLVAAATAIFNGRTRDGPLLRWGIALAERAGRGKARIAVARRLAVIMLAMWKSGTEYHGNLAG